MNKLLLAFTAVLSCIAIGLAAGSQTFRRVDAGGHQVRMLMTGHGGPAVIFEAGAGGPLECWVRVQSAVSKFTSTLAYDRAGNGLAPRGPTPRDGRQVARELHAALQNARV